MTLTELVAWLRDDGLQVGVSNPAGRVCFENLEPILDQLRKLAESWPHEESFFDDGFLMGHRPASCRRCQLEAIVGREREGERE